MTDHEHTYHHCNRPAIALITNHGYGGVEIPMGGAPDTGGQNMYVNALAKALDNLGYRVTVFARGGFPGFDNGPMRDQPEYLTPHVRYVYIPGGGDSFIRKEDIALALDEEVEWLERFIESESAGLGVKPWQQYELINTHYWDAAVMGVRLIERWRDDIAMEAIAKIVEGAVPSKVIDQLHAQRHNRSVGADPGHAIGRLLIDAHAAPNAPLDDTLHKAADALVKARSIPNHLAVELTNAIRTEAGYAEEKVHHAVRPTWMAACFGEAVLLVLEDFEAAMTDQLCFADRHCWTPHSLGELKDANYQGRPVDVRRDLKFCERRSHERMVCDRTPAFASTSPEISERLCTQYGVLAEHIAFFPPCLDTELFRPYEGDELDGTYRYLAETTGLAEGDIRGARVVFEASRMDETKRKDLLLSAFERVLDDHPNTYCFIGGGPTNGVFDALQAQINASDRLKGRAFLLRPVPDEHIGKMFALADVYGTASEMEGFGMSASQAAVARTAVVGSDLVPYCVDFAGGDAVVFPAGDAGAMAEAISGLLSDDNDREQRAIRLEAGARLLNWESAATDLLSRLRSQGFDIAQGLTEPAGAAT